MKASKLLRELATLRVASPADQRQWFVTFANWDGGLLSAGEWRQLKKEIAVYFALGLSAVRQRELERLVVVEWTGWRRITRNDLKRAHRGVRRVLTQATQRMDKTWTGFHYVPIRSLQYSSVLPPGGGQLLTSLKGGLADALPYCAYVLTTQGDAEPLRQCPACKRFFVRVRRQKFCQNGDCAKKRRQDYFARYVTTPKGREARRRQYETFMLKETKT